VHLFKAYKKDFLMAGVKGLDKTKCELCFRTEMTF